MNEQRGIVVSPRLLWGTLSAAAIVVGSLGPWITAGPFTAGGTANGGDGVITLILGILGFALVIAERSRPAVAAVAAAALAIGVIDTSLVLRTEGNELFSIGLGWGLIVLCLGAASLLVWGVVEVLQGDGSRRRAIALTVATVALIGTVGILAASGRFDDPNDEEEPVTQLESNAAEEAPEEDPAPTGPGTEPCDDLGINAERRREGDCLASNGWLVQVVNRSSTATLDDMAVSLVDVTTRASIRDLADEEVEPEGVFVEATLRITNRSKRPFTLSDSLFALTADDTTNTPTSAFIASDDQLGSGGDLGPGLSRTGTVVFDVAQSTADALATDGNVVMAQPSDDGGLQDPKQRVAFVRTYGPAPGAQSAPATPTSPTRKAEPAPEADVQGDTKSCGNLTVTNESITCEFAQNVFYEYWTATEEGSGEADAITAFSPALGRSLSLSCNAGASVTCATDAGGEVTIPREALDEYTQDDAAAYAASNPVDG